MKKTGSLVLVLLLVAGVIFYFSSQPYSKQSLIPLLEEKLPHEWMEARFSFISYEYAGNEISIENYGVSSFVEFHIRKGAHLFVFACFSIFAFFVAKRVLKSTFWRVFFALSLTSGYAALDEFHQSLTPERTPAIQDVLLDMTGALIGLIILFGWTSLLRKIRIHRKNA